MGTHGSPIWTLMSLPQTTLISYPQIAQLSSDFIPGRIQLFDRPLPLVLEIRIVSSDWRYPRLQDLVHSQRRFLENLKQELLGKEPWHESG